MKGRTNCVKLFLEKFAQSLISSLIGLRFAFQPDFDFSRRNRLNKRNHCVLIMRKSFTSTFVWLQKDNKKKEKRKKLFRFGHLSKLRLENKKKHNPDKNGKPIS